MQGEPVVRVVVATQKKTETEFKAATFLGQSLGMCPPQLRPELSVLLDNGGPDCVGLSEFYNSFLEVQYRNEIALFIHDDVYLNRLVFRISLASRNPSLRRSGRCSNADPDFAEPSWALGWNREKYPSGWQRADALSGAVAHYSKKRAGVGVSYYGPAPRQCKLLDGLFLAVNVGRAVEGGVRFDEQFQFHFYHLDFCRTADARGLRIGTWPIALTHGSGGAFGSDAWVSARERYMKKWAV